MSVAGGSGIFLNLKLAKSRLNLEFKQEDLLSAEVETDRSKDQQP
ncbi:MAG: hypothetical protein ACE5JP_17285 [Candidatus Bipolaricaulia bacterium]